MNKTPRLFLYVVALISISSAPDSWDSLFGGGDDAFSGFDFGGGGGFDDLFGGDDFGGGDPFASLFSGGSDLGLSFGPETGGKGDKKKKKEVPLPKTEEEAFTKGMSEPVTPLPAIYRSAVLAYVQKVSEPLGALLQNLSGLGLGITARDQLAQSIETISELSAAVEKVKSQTVYFPILLSKDHEKLRKSLIAFPKKAEDVISALSAVEGPKDTLDAPSAKEQKAQKDLVKKIESFVSKTIAPLKKELDALLAHKKTTEAIAKKQKKYKDREAKAAQASRGGGSGGYGGGWGSGSGGYFDNDFGDFFGGSGGWDSFGGGSDFWNDFGGGGYDSYGGGYGGYSGYGGGYSSSGYRSSSPSYSSSSSSSSSSPSSSGTRSAAPRTSFAYDFEDDDYAGSNKQLKAFSGGGVYQTGEKEKTPQEKVKSLQDSVVKKVSGLSNKYEKAKTAGGKRIAIKEALQDRVFGAALEQLLSLLDLLDDPEVPESALEKTVDKVKPLLPFLIKAAKYASPPFSGVMEETVLVKKKKMSKEKAQKEIEVQRHRMEKAYGNLMKLLAVIRSEDRFEDLFDKAVALLAAEAEETIDALSEHIAKTTAAQTFEETQLFATLSEQLLREPIVIGYSTLQDSDDDEKDEKQKQLQPLVDKKKVLDAKAHTFITKQLDDVQACLQQADAAIELLAADRGHAAADLASDSQWWPVISQKLQELRNPVLSPLIPFKHDVLVRLRAQSMTLEKLEAMWRPAPETSEEPDTVADEGDATEYDSEASLGELDEWFDEQKPSFMGRMKNKLIGALL